MAAETFQFSSTNIDEATFDEETGTLEVSFLRIGASYTITGVTPEEWERFKLAPSAGRFYRDTFMNRAT